MVLPGTGLRGLSRTWGTSRGSQAACSTVPLYGSAEDGGPFVGTGGLPVLWSLQPAVLSK